MGVTRVESGMRALLECSPLLLWIVYAGDDTLLLKGLGYKRLSITIIAAINVITDIILLLVDT